MIAKNTQQPFQIHSKQTASDFLALSTGMNLRWEFMGLIFAMAGRTAMAEPLDGAHIALPRGCTALTFAHRMTECSNACISLNRQQATSSDVFIWCLYENLILLTLQHGESSHFVWQRLGDLSAEIFAQGFHQICESPSNLPLFLVQSRKKVFHASYTIDKNLATFFGRPPRIAAYYCSTKLPFDIDDSILLEGSHFHPSAFNSNAWNEDGRFYSATWIRIRSINSQIKEKVLELLLTPSTATITSKAELVSTRCLDSWETIPASLRYDRDCPTLSTPTSACTFLSLMVLVEHLQNVFQLRRFLSQGHFELAPRDSLVDVSVRIITTITVFTAAVTKVAQMHKDPTWILLHFAVPCAGVLANELRSRTQRREPYPPFISRSQIIRHISVTISTLEAVSSPSDGNFNLCIRAAESLSHILSDVLDNPTPASLFTNDLTAMSPSSISLLGDDSSTWLPHWFETF
ncbi:hypothetical protein K431DRAFT_236072 [Polychaeton citri CBS 116435]|uniref:Xylanolytic transcriptional activator regulatory domain-containing protein n=1 Tax=Polychaeton citri CBS 116435 TaxID=1314669 RepID=A0A9P4UJ92_9PEZI|nr:hypothetical protein K431DRAFT_236072 [Polychaeton citri CBS 116435]